MHQHSRPAHRYDSEIEYWKHYGLPIHLQKTVKRTGFASFNDWGAALADLCTMAEREDWSKRNKDGSLDKTGELADHLCYKYRWIANTYYASRINENIAQQLIFSSGGNGDQGPHGRPLTRYAVFDTGLLTRDSKEVIYALFERNCERNYRNGPDDPPYSYEFKEW